MAKPLRDFFFGTQQNKRDLVTTSAPRRTFNDVILPASTRRALDHALQQIRKRELIFGTWGLGEKHATGLGVALNFAGPPGTGKTACAEAIANALQKPLLVVRYSEMESLWAGETGKNVAAVFNAAREQDAVLFFDEADAIAGRRFSSVTQGYQREANTVVNVLLKELEEFDGVVIFATNLAANFDPAFERRVRTHILFEMPGAEERAQIWKVQLSSRTPLAPDVDFQKLGEKYAVAGGDIKNAVIKAAQMATAEAGADAGKKITQRHFEAAMEEVIAAKKVMGQSIFEGGDGSNMASAMEGLNGAWGRMVQSQSDMESEVVELTTRLGESERRIAAIPSIIERFDDVARSNLNVLRADVTEKLDDVSKAARETSEVVPTLRAEVSQLRDESGALRGDVSTLREETSALRGETSALRELALSAQTDASKLRDDTARMHDELRLELKRIGSDIATVGASVEKLRPALDEQSARLDEQNARLNDVFSRHAALHEEVAKGRELAERVRLNWRASLAIAIVLTCIALTALVVAII